MENSKIEILLSQILENQNSMKSEINDMKSDISSMKSDIGDMKSEISSMKSDIGGMKSEISSIKSDMKNGFDAVTNRIDALSNGLGNMVTNDIADELSNQLKEIKDDIEFLTHKTTETEKDVYKIQNHLKIVK